MSISNYFYMIRAPAASVVLTYIANHKWPAVPCYHEDGSTLACCKEGPRFGSRPGTLASYSDEENSTLGEDLHQYNLLKTLHNFKIYKYTQSRLFTIPSQ
jgi:hypothetical protein